MKKCQYLLLIVALILFAQSSALGQDKTEQKIIIYTTLDVKQEYEIVEIIAATYDVTSTFSGSPILKAYTNAWDQFKKNAETIGADAVVGVRIELENMNGQIVGRVLIYGTAVKFINKTVEN